MFRGEAPPRERGPLPPRKRSEGDAPSVKELERRPRAIQRSAHAERITEGHQLLLGFDPATANRKEPERPESEVVSEAKKRYEQFHF